MAMSYPREGMLASATLSLFVRDLPPDRGRLEGGPLRDRRGGPAPGGLLAAPRPRPAGRAASRPARRHGRLRRDRQRRRRHPVRHPRHRHHGPLVHRVLPERGGRLPGLRPYPSGPADVARRHLRHRARRRKRRPSSRRAPARPGLRDPARQRRSGVRSPNVHASCSTRQGRLALFAFSSSVCHPVSSARPAQNSRG